MDDRSHIAQLDQLATSTEVPCAANNPVLMADADELWVVEEGAVDLFLVPLKGREVVGMRHYLWSADTGDSVVGVEPRPTDGNATEEGSDHVGLLAVGTAGTRLKRFSLKELATLAEGSEPARQSLGAAIDSYVAALSRGAAEAHEPQHDVLLQPGTDATVGAGAHAGTAGDLVWVHHDTGSSQFLGLDHLVIDRNDAFLPLGKGLYVECTDETASLTVIDTDTALTQGQAVNGLSLLRALFMAFAEIRSQQEQAGERRRMLHKAENEATMLRRGVVALASVLGSGRRQAAVVSGDEGLLGTLRILGEAAGIEFREPPSWEASGRVHDELGAICRASRVRDRRVALRGNWWKHDAGPLLGFFSSDIPGHVEEPAAALESHADARSVGGASRDREETKHEPVTLLPDNGGRYRYVDAATGDLRRVTPTVAAALEPFAYSFYRPLPDEPLGAASLLKVAFAGQRRDLLIVLAMAIAAGLLGVALPVATGKMFSVVIPTADSAEVLVLFAALVAVNLGTAFFDLTRAFALVRIEGQTTNSLQAGIVDRLLALPVPFFRDFSTGDLTQRALGVNTVRSMVSGAAVVSLLVGFMAVSNLGLMVYYDHTLALVAVAILVVVSIITFGLAVPTLRAERRRIDKQGKIAGTVFQMIGGIAKLRIAAAEGRGFAVWAKGFQGQKTDAMRAQGFRNAVTVLNDTVPLLGTLALFATATWRIKNGTNFNTGQFIAFNAAFGIFFSSGVTLSNTLVGLLNVKPVLDRARPILDAVPEVDAAKPDPGELSGRIEVNHVKFRYFADGPLVLDDVTFETSPGEFIALVGPSGSGKSTCLRLLLGFERPESGAVYVDGQDLASLDHSAVRSQIGVVLQSSRILAGDILNNLVGSAPLTLDDAWEAAEAAGIADDIKAMPMGMHTVISEGGGTISGGQRQRLLIARALIRKPRIILFDEATSALDNRTQQQVTDSLDRLHTARLVIAHRLSTIRHADRIYVIDAGKVTQSGSFDKLVNEPGMFAELVKRQMA